MSLQSAFESPGVSPGVWTRVISTALESGPESRVEEVRVIVVLRVRVIKAKDHAFYGFTGVITDAGCWENTRKACRSRAEGE